MKSVLRIAVQKKGRLSDDSLKLISNCGISFMKYSNRLKTSAYNFPMEFLYLRDDDIPQYVQDGVADIGILGENELLEKNKSVSVVERLGFSKCRLSLAVPRDFDYQQLSDLDGLNIATSYPHVLAGFLKKEGLSCTIHEIGGSVEIAPGIGLAEAICDIVSSGSTLLSNGLKEVAVVMKSEAVLIANNNLPAEKQLILDQLHFRINSVLKARQYKYILLNLPDSSIEHVCSLLPGMKSPTVLPLVKEGWSSLHSVVREDEFWAVIDGLKSAGAEGILVSPIEKMIL